MLSKFKQSSRTPQELRHHYEIEKKLATKLRKAPRNEREKLYAQVYDELYRNIPALKKEMLKSRPRDVAVQLKTLKPYLNKNLTFLEVGPGNCSLSVAVAKTVKRAFAVDVSNEVHKDWQGKWPKNLTLIHTNGTDIPVPASSIDLVYSHQLMEHLHPEDATDQLQQIYRALKPGGNYLCITPNKLFGPSDISGFFDQEATGLHLKEYTQYELTQLLKSAGFVKIHSLYGAGGHHLKMPTFPAIWLEYIIQGLPRSLGRKLSGWLPMRAILGIRLLAHKQKSP